MRAIEFLEELLFDIRDIDLEGFIVISTPREDCSPVVKPFALFFGPIFPKKDLFVGVTNPRKTCKLAERRPERFPARASSRHIPPCQFTRTDRATSSRLTADKLQQQVAGHKLGIFRLFVGAAPVVAQDTPEQHCHLGASALCRMCWRREHLFHQHVHFLKARLPAGS